MDTPRSWFLLQSFAEHVEKLHTNPDSEKLIRESMAGFMATCPREVLVKAANVIYDCRMSELKAPTNN